jgi:hypothetical protein
MKKLAGSKRGAAVLPAIAVAAVAAVAGYAYFTASGSGSGAVAMGTAPSVALSSDTVGPMFPGQTKAVTVVIQNPSPGDLHVGEIDGSVQTDDNGTPSDPSDDCPASWFTVAPIAAQTVPANSTVDSTTSLTMAETGASQDGCQSKLLTVDWSTSGGQTSAGGAGGGDPAAHLIGLSVAGSSGNVRTLRVTLDRVVTATTDVLLSSSDPSKVDVHYIGVGVQAGHSTNDIPVTVLDPAGAVVTATLGADSIQLLVT